LNGKKSDDPEGFAQAKVHVTKGAALPDLRTSAGIHAEVPDVQDLLSQARKRRSDSWSDEIELVGSGI